MPVRRALIPLFLAACATAPADTEPDTDPFAEGAALYATHCAECHGEDGGGTPDGPSLEIRLLGGATPAEVAEVITEGYDDMPAVEEITAAEAVVVATWVVDAFGP
jgi:mono/diheme cytochrome c family protein